MKRQEYIELKRQLTKIHRDLETELLTPEQQRILESRATKLTRSLQRRDMLNRAMLGAMVGVALAVLGQFIVATPQPSSGPETTAEFATLYVGVCILSGLAGAVLGAMFGR
jgi:hypothetical protein